jgi:hypothetical protein
MGGLMYYQLLVPVLLPVAGADPALTGLITGVSCATGLRAAHLLVPVELAGDVCPEASWVRDGALVHLLVLQGHGGVIAQLHHGCVCGSGMTRGITRGGKLAAYRRGFTAGVMAMDLGSLHLASLPAPWMSRKVMQRRRHPGQRRSWRPVVRQHGTRRLRFRSKRPGFVKRV